MALRDYTATEMSEMVGAESIEKVNVWLARGDGIAVYENQDLNAPDSGERKFFSFGSGEAVFLGVLPDRLPDFPGEINWRFILVGTYRGHQLEPPREHDYKSPAYCLDLIVDAFRSKVIGHPDRLRSYGMQVNSTFGTETSHVTFNLTVRTEDANDNGRAAISIRTWTTEKGEVDRLAPFSWIINGGPGPQPFTGGDPNLGATIVSVYNNSRHK